MSAGESGIVFHSSDSVSSIFHTAIRAPPAEKLYLRGMPRRWYFLLRAPIPASEQPDVEQRIRQALQGWNTHGRPIPYEVSFPYDHYVAITAHTPVSGCATDHLFRTLLPLLNPLPAHFLLTIQEGKMKTENFYEIIKQKQRGQWGADWLIVEVVGEEIVARRLEESSLLVHL